MQIRLRDILQDLLLICWERYVWWYSSSRRDSSWDCSILAKCLRIWEALMVVIKKNFYRVIIESGFQLVSNVIHDKILISWDTVNLIKDIRNICPMFKEVSISYRARECNKAADRVVKMATSIRYNCPYTSCYFNIVISFLVQKKNCSIQQENKINNKVKVMFKKIM